MRVNCIFIFCLLIIVFCNTGYAVAKKAETKEDSLTVSKGYLVFAIFKTDEEVIFLPDSNANPAYSFDELQKIKGWLLRGQNLYDLYKAKLASTKYHVFLPIINKAQNTKSSVAIQLGIIPVQLVYYMLPLGKLKEDSGIPFDYNEKRYVFYYVDDWDVAIEEIKIID